MSSEIEDTLLASEAGTASESADSVSPSSKAAGPSAEASADSEASVADGDASVAKTQLGSQDAKTDSASDEALAETQGHEPDSGAGLEKTQIGRPSKSFWIPLSLQKAQLPTVARDTYEVDRELARGGMGRIMSAHDKRLGRPVAIKELLRGSAAARARFVREACITARLQHPAIVPLYEAGHWPNGEPFFAMKMVAGEPLDEVSRRCKSNEERLALLGRVLDVADALAYAHSKEVIHRDLKPANVLVGDFGETVVIDWGLAKHLDRDDEADEFDREAAQMNREAETLDGEDDKGASQGDSNALTVMGQAMGTPSYMAPEQARGEKVDKRADVYSLGAILYQVLSGKVAYSGSKSAAEVLGKVLQGPPQALGEITDGLAAPLLTIVKKAMARDRDERYPDASVFADELRSYQTGNLVSAHEYSTSALLWRWVQSHRTLVVSASVMVLVGLVASVLSFRSIGKERDKAKEAESQARVSAALADQERENATRKSVELGLTLAFSLADRQPLEALQEIAGLDDIGLFPDMIARARVIAAQARSHRVTTEFTARGGKHGDFQLSPDDKEIAVAWNEKEVALLDVESRSIEIVSAIKMTSVEALRYSPSGTLLAVFGEDEGENSREDGVLVLWDREKQEVALRIDGLRDPQALVFSPDGHWLVAIAYMSVTLYDLSDIASAPQTARSLKGSTVKQVAFSPDSKTLAYLRDDLHFYHLETHTSEVVLAGDPIPNIPARRTTYDELIFTPDGKTLLLARENVSALDVETRALTELFTTTQRVNTLAVSSDGKTLAAGGGGQIIYLYDFRSRTEGKLYTLVGHARAIGTLTFASDDKELVASGQKGQLRIWHIGVALGRAYYQDQLPEILTSRLRPEQRPILFHDESRVLAYDESGTLLAWNRERPDVRALGPASLYARAIFTVGRELLVWTTGGLHTKLNVEKAGEETRRIGDHGEQIEALQLSPDDRYLASAGKSLKLWDLEKGTMIELKGHESHMRNLVFFDQSLFSVDVNGQVFRWDLSSGEGSLVAEHGGYLNGFVGFAADPQGRWVVTAGGRGKVYLHNLQKGTKRLLTEGGNSARGLAVSKAGDLLAFSTKDSELAIYTPLDENEPTLLRSPLGKEHLAFPDFSPDERSLVISAGNVGLRLWPDWKAEPTNSRLLHSEVESLFPKFSPDGLFVLAPGNSDAVASMWHVPTGQRRDLKGRSANGKAEFWPAGKSLVVSNIHGGVTLWLDELPHDWESLRAWILEQIAVHRSAAPAY